MQKFRLDLENGLILSSDLSESKVAVIPDVNKQDMENGYIWYALPLIEINGEKIVLNLCFFQSKLQSVNISISNPELYGTSWSDFSEDKEKLRAKNTEKWLSDIGYSTGKYSWGEIWAGYDSKGGSGHAVVHYALEQENLNVDKYPLAGLRSSGSIANKYLPFNLVVRLHYV
ncbi:hypothetical protein [Planctobacterium marinum]|uniref:hypothetical protein n=1 Tax=Planctobacterium marinum TaxID=1631968 RepID=UPI001E517FF8|nr:hypothetical protein [Planctobacterium marinum]MCC2607026.1 hypothetical protein [Planctobacterium marinum]